MLYWVRYWYQFARIERDGYRWVIHSAEEWSDYTGMTKDMVHKALKALAERGLIVKKRHEWYGGRKRVLAWIRPTPWGSASLNGDTGVA